MTKKRDTADDAAFLEEARERFSEAMAADRDNRDAALDDLKFLAGEQWEASVRTAREAKGRPCLTINRLPQFIAQIVGDIRINRPAIRVRPAEDADKDLADIREGLIRAIERDSDAQGVYATAGQAQVSCGIGNYRVALDYASDDAFDRDIVIRPIPNPLAVVWDPYAIDPTGRDAKYCFVVDEMSKKDFDKAYPDQQVPSELGNLASEGWCKQDAVRVTEYWTIKETPVEIHQLEDGSIVDELPEGATPVKSRKTVRKSAQMHLISGHAILAGPYDLPISRLPVLRVMGWEFPVGDRRVRCGLVRFAKDPQRLLNYWRSTSAEVLALAPKQQWLLHESQDGYQDQFRNAHNSGDNILTWHGNTPPVRVEPPATNTAVLQEAAINAQDMKDVTGLHDASLGAKSNETSGKAILARQKEGDVAAYVYHDNLQASIRECGRIVNELIPVVYDTARTARVVGEDDAVKLQRINDPMHPESIDIKQGKYDIVVEVGPSYSTKRAEAAESMLAFVQAIPQAAQLVGDLVAKSMDWPMADKFAERLKGALPPGVAQDDDEEQKAPDPMQQQMMQAQQAQGQMQQMAMQIELRTKEAQARQAEANAAKAEAEAMMAGVAMQQPPESAPQVDPRLNEAQVALAQAKALREHLAAASDHQDLQMKPMEVAHSAADLHTKLNPPPETKPKAKAA